MKGRCKCGSPTRSGQRTCKPCHAAYMREYRARKAQPLAEVKTLLLPVPDVVAVLEDMLEMAKQGRLRAVAVAGTLSQGESCNAWGGLYYPTALIGELHILSREIADAHIDMRAKPAGQSYDW